MSKNRFQGQNKSLLQGSKATQLPKSSFLTDLEKRFPKVKVHFKIVLFSIIAIVIHVLLHVSVSPTSSLFIVQTDRSLVCFWHVDETIKNEKTFWLF